METSRFAFRPVVRAITFAGMLFAGTVGTATAQEYPAKPPRVIVGAPSGSLIDILARLAFTRVGESLKQPFVVENRPGASGNIAAEAVAKAPADGYTLMVAINNVFVVNPFVYSNPGFDPSKDFEPIMMLAKVSEVLVVNPSLGVKTVDAFVKAAKASPGRITYASGGAASPMHLVMELLQAKADIKLVHVPYKGPSLAMQGMAAGEVQALSIGIGLARPFIQSGKLVAIARTGHPAKDAYRELPMLQDLYPGAEWVAWLGVVAPKGTPANIVTRLNTELGRALADPGIVEKMATLDLTPMGGTPADLARAIQAELPVNSALVKSIGLKLD